MSDSEFGDQDEVDADPKANEVDKEDLERENNEDFGDTHANPDLYVK